MITSPKRGFMSSRWLVIMWIWVWSSQLVHHYYNTESSTKNRLNITEIKITKKLKTVQYEYEIIKFFCYATLTNRCRKIFSIVTIHCHQFRFRCAKKIRPSEMQNWLTCFNRKLLMVLQNKSNSKSSRNSSLVLAKPYQIISLFYLT